MRVLLSIKPEFVKKIISGEKKVEFRRKIFKRNVRIIVVYASSPWKSVIGEFVIEDIIKLNLPRLWKITKHEAGIDEKFFWQYFAGQDYGYAIKIKDFLLYKKKLDIEKHFGLKPPQSCVYIL